MSVAPLRLRLATLEDASAVAQIYAPVVQETCISFELEAPDAAEMRRRIEATLARTPWLVVEAKDRLAGYAYAGPFRARPAYQWTAETTVYVDPAFQRRGVGSALYVALLESLRALGYRSAVGGITLPNPSSVALHERLGFLPVGIVRAAGFKLGSWHDVGFWQVQLRGGDPPGRPPWTLAEILSTPAWAEALERGQARLRA